jgi:hypothetical protein
MLTKLSACVVAAALILPQAAFGNDGEAAKQPASEWKSVGALPLPPIPHLETIPWLTAQADGQHQKADPSRGPDLDTLMLATGKDAALTTRYSSMQGRAAPHDSPKK